MTSTPQGALLTLFALAEAHSTVKKPAPCASTRSKCGNRPPLAPLSAHAIPITDAEKQLASKLFCVSLLPAGILCWG